MRWFVIALVACNGAAKSPPQQQQQAPQPARALRAGMPFELRVRVLSDGKPLGDTPGRVYHTDAEGYYLRNPDGSEAGGDHARLAFRVRTDADGRFTLRTILPAPYPSGGPPAHVHMHVPPESPDDLTIMLDVGQPIDRDHIARLARTVICKVHVEGELAICKADIATR